MEGWRAMSYVLDEDDNQVSEECLYWCTPGTASGCESPECHCGCHDDQRRAAELDDRPDPALHNIVRDVTAERTPTLDELRAERHGDPRWLPIERFRRSA